MLLADVAVHAVYVADAEARGEDGDLHLLLQGVVDGNTPLQLEVGSEATHEVVDLVHLLHGQSIGAILAAEGYGEENLLRVIDVVVVEQR